MYKKWIAAVLIVALSISVVACSEDSTGETSSVNPSQTVTTAPTASATNPQQPHFQETVLVDNEDLFFAITAIENDPIWGYTLKTQIENRTDKDLMFSLRDVSVNGYMCDPYFAVTVTAGMKAIKDISFSTDSFAEIGIQNVTDIEFELRAYDSNDWSADAVFDEAFTIYPQGKDASKEYPRENQDGDIILFDSETCTMIVTGFEQDSIWGYNVNVYLVNKTDDALMFSVGNAAINGFMCDPYFATTVAPGKQCITDITWTKNVLEENNISKVDSISLPVRVYKANEWDGKNLIDETFTLKP